MKHFSILNILFFLTSCGHQMIRPIDSTNSSQNLKSNNDDLSETQVLARTVKKKYDDVNANTYGRVRGTASLPDGDLAKSGMYYLYGAEHLNLENNYFDIPVVYNDAVKRWMDYFLSRGRKFFVSYVERSGRYAPILGRILEDNGLPRDLIFLAMAESGFHNKAKSWAKAVGPWQFMPFTGRRYGLEIDWFIDERRDPIKATVAAGNYLKDLYEMFNSWELAAAGYNAGEGKVSRAIRKYKTDNFWDIRRGRYLKSETKNYVPKIMALAIIGKNLKSFGMGDIEFHEPLDFDEIEVNALTDLFKVAAAIQVEAEELYRLNPEIMRWVTPPTRATYRLRVPVGSLEKWNECCTNQKDQFLASDFQKYFNRKNASLNEVAKQFKVPVQVLANLNKLDQNSFVKKGDEILLPFHSSQNWKDSMYADLHEKASRRFRGKTSRNNNTLARALKRGEKITTPRQFYTVKRGDTLWDVSRKLGVSMDTIIRSNYKLVSNRSIREGDRLIVR